MLKIIIRVLLILKHFPKIDFRALTFLEVRRDFDSEFSDKNRGIHEVFFPREILPLRYVM